MSNQMAAKSKIIGFIIGAIAVLSMLFALHLPPVRKAHAAGTIPVALVQQFNANGQPLVGCLLYLYVTGTVATPQLAYRDSALSSALAWPVPCDATGRLPMFYLADGSIHPRLTDAGGVVQFDYPSMLVIGGSITSGTSPGGSIDPTTIATTGDVKFRPTADTITGWVKLNGTQIGSAVSGASGRANADTQALYIYLWGVCPDAHCTVNGGRGASGLADFNANKPLLLPDMRGRTAVGLDDMGNVVAGVLTSPNNFSVGDTTITPNGAGGASFMPVNTFQVKSGNDASVLAALSPSMNPFLLGSWYMKL